MLFALSSTCENYKQKHIRVNSVLIFCRSLQFRTIIIILCFFLIHVFFFYFYFYFLLVKVRQILLNIIWIRTYITFTTAKFNEMFIASKFTHRALYARLDKYMVVHIHMIVLWAAEK